MGWFDGLFKRVYNGGKSVKLITFDNSLFSYENKIDELRQCNAYQLALSLAEVSIPIDAIASRVSALFYEIQDKEGNPIKLTNRQRELLESPNPLTQRFSDLIYAIVFSELADGNAYVYRNSLGQTNPDYISSIWCLNPSLITVNYRTASPDILDITKKSDLVSFYQFNLSDKELSPEDIIHTTSSFLQQNYNSGMIEGRSPLLAAKANVDNLLLVYQARKKVYKHNGMAGILSRASAPTNGGIEAAIDPVTRDSIIKDIQAENGLTGDKKFWSISANPLTFTKTLGTISELQPFEEAEADAVAIGAIYGVDKELIPKRASSTFTNKRDAEISLWQNIVKPISDDVCRILNQAFLLPKEHRFVAKSDHIEVLQEDYNTRIDSDAKIIDNIIKIKSSGYEDDPIIKKILGSYE